MQNALETLIDELKKQNQLLQAANKIGEERLRVSEEKLRNSEEKLESTLEKVKYLEFQVEQLNRMLFGAKRERFISNAAVNQLELPFDVEPDEAVSSPQETTEETIAYTRQKPKKYDHPGRLDFPSHIPVEEIVIEPEQSTEGLKCIGQEITKELDYTPPKLIVRHYIRPKYALPGGEGIVIGKLPTRPIEKGIAGAGLLANIAVEKFVDHLPIYRQIERFKREQINIPATTIDSWMAQMADLLEPLYDHLKKLVIGQGYLQVDETPIKVLDHAHKNGKTHQGYFWVYNAPLQNALFYDYRKGRGREGPKELLKTFKGYLQTDGYKAYEWFAQQPAITHMGCMAHARRYFEQALSYDATKAGIILMMIQKLYETERDAKETGLSPEKRKELRLEKSLPVLNQMGKTIAEMNKTALPQSPMGKALNYSINRWDSLMNYLYDGSLEIDNNWIENSIRPCALGRKNYLFAGSHEGAKRAAIFYSFFGTCKKNNINPYNWLKETLKVIPDYPANKIGDLLPQNFKPSNSNQ
jgi:transposase